MKRLKVLLLRPFSEADELIPPFGLGYLATAIRDKHDVQILDGIKEKLTLDGLADLLNPRTRFGIAQSARSNAKAGAGAKKENFDVIGIQVFTHHINTVKNYIKIIKKNIPKAYIVLGGPHPSCSPEDIFEYFPEASFAFKGEAEAGLKGLLEEIRKPGFRISEAELSNIPGLIWREENNKTIVNQPAFVEELDSLGYPSWDLLRPDSYPLAPHGAFFKNHPIAPIIITRGCPYSCTYCAGPLISGRIIRKRSIDSVITEIKELYHKYNIKEIHIEDDNFTFDREMVMEFCCALKENNLNISWTCPNGVRLDTLDKELLLAMKASGLYSISVGIESGSDRILKDMRKSLTKAKIREKIRLLRETGLEVSGFFILGYPTETKEDILQTLAFSRSLGLKRAGFSAFKPFPGTEITKLLVQKGAIDNEKEDWEKYVLAKIAYLPPGISEKELKNLRRRALIRFYLRPKIIFKMLSEIKNFKHFKLVMKRTYRWFFK